jgi:multidrug efflux system membrane fusion protein
VLFYLPEQELNTVRAAQQRAPLEVAAMDRSDAHLLDNDGILQVIDNQIDQNTGTFKLRAEFSNPQELLWPGQFVNVRLKVRTVADALVVPGTAVQRGPEGDYVYLVQADHTVKLQPVVQGAEVDDSHVVISKGLRLGDKVVTEGQFRLKPGSKVQALAPGQLPVAAPPHSADPKPSRH